MEGRKRDFTDDCGIWGSSGTSVNSHYIIENGKLKNVPLKNGQYCTEKKVQKKRIYVPLQPQPSSDQIFHIHRYYAKLKEDESYRKRVTIFTRLPSMYSDNTGICVIEYLGDFKGKTLKHGNSKSSNLDVPYERTKPAVLQNIKCRLKRVKTWHWMIPWKHRDPNRSGIRFITIPRKKTMVMAKFTTLLMRHCGLYLCAKMVMEIYTRNDPYSKKAASCDHIYR
ncbi:hypothetical protein FSP39_004306 [Pinctada imbricata]|uniref:Uncharacterized protein n=1 Tax=Pinctada imbricata TaxID=66713 RepID=A0AA88YVR4_PINIB|nr:hypothetical protein FSP39_004306 [Pinctada imbricata]